MNSAAFAYTAAHALDPAKRSVRVTREIAGYIANVARSLDGSGHDPVTVAMFLMRCLFTMFAEDIELLPSRARAAPTSPRY
jgi:hypothetical protein